MSDWKSKLPDLNELTSMSNKLYKGIKGSVLEIVDDYKKKRQTEEAASTTETPPKSAPKKESKVEPQEQSTDDAPKV